MTKLSVIIPARPEETALPALLSQLEAEPAVGEVLVMREAGRAKSLNAGAARATGDLLWFLHADSRLVPGSVEALLSADAAAPDALHFFDLAFAADATPLVRLNQWGANLRARLLSVPFGDQGLACRHAVFEAAGGFPEDAAYGEDHLFVWRARQAGVRLRPIGLPLVTSARSYAEHGWLSLTARHQYRWLAQAAPEAWRLLAGRRRA